MPIISADKHAFFRPEGGIGEIQSQRLMGHSNLGGLRVPTGASTAMAQTVGGLARDTVAWGERVVRAETQDEAHRAALAMTKALNQAEAETLQEADYQSWPERLEKKARDIRLSHRKAFGAEAFKHAEQKFAVTEESRLRQIQFKALQQSIKTQHANTLGEFNDTLELISAADHPEEVKTYLADFRANVEGKVDAGVIDAVEGFRLVSSLEEKTGRLKADQDLLVNPGMALEKLGSDEWMEHYPGLNPTVRPALMGKAQARVAALEREAEQEARKAQAIRLKEFGNLLDDHLASISATGQGIPGMEAMAVELLEDSQFELFKTTVTHAHRKFNVSREIRFMPPEQALARVEAFRPEPGTEGFSARWDLYQDLRQAWHENVQALAKDPAAFVASDPSVKTVQDALAMQDYLGVPAYRQRVMTKQEASEMVLQIQALPPKDRPAAIRQIQGQTEQHYGLAFSQLVDEGLDPTTQIQASVLDDPVALDQISAAAAAGRKELKDSIGDSFLVSDTQEAIRAEIGDYMESVQAYLWDAETIKRFNEVQGAITDMALYSVSKGKDPNAAAREAVERVITSKYHPMGGGWFWRDALDTARIPVSVDRDLVKEQAGAVLETLGEFDLDLPAEGRGRYIKAIKKDGYWAARPDDSGLVLMYNGAPVLTSEGDFVSFDFPGQRIKIR